LDGRVLKFPSTGPNDLRVTVYDPSSGARGAIRNERISNATGKHLFETLLYGKRSQTFLPLNILDDSSYQISP